MRVIKFKGLSKNGWEYGLPYFAHGTGCWKITRSNGWQPSYQNPDEGESTEWIDVDANTIGEFTGLKDKNGKEIYEGDLLGFKNYAYEVKFDKGAFCLFSKYGKWGSLEKSIQVQEKLRIDLEIIGNIHENPELISG